MAASSVLSVEFINVSYICILRYFLIRKTCMFIIAKKLVEIDIHSGRLEFHKRNFV